MSSNERYTMATQVAHLQAKYTGTGQADTTKRYEISGGRELAGGKQHRVPSFRSCYLRFHSTLFKPL